jgi:multidrug efflux pump subunit AcrA (membrane-fusion protein)
MSALDKYTAQAEAELAKLMKPIPRPKHDFTAIGEQIVASLVKAAEDQVTEAQNLLESVKVLAEGIGAQLEEHARMLNDMDDRTRAFGRDVVEAHKKFLNGGRHENPSP